MTWLRANWRLVLVALGSVLAFALGGFLVPALRRPHKRIRRELAASRATADAIEHGADIAVSTLALQHRDTIALFDEAQRARLDAMRSDPAALARWLTELSE